MPNYDDDGEEIIDPLNDPTIPAGLRKALKALQKENDTLKTAKAQSDAQVRERNVKDVLEAKGVNSKIAKFIPSDISTPEAVATWLTENADLFSATKPAGETAAETDPANAEDAAALNKINNATETAIPATKLTDIAAKLSAKNITRAELDAITGIDSTSGRRG